MMNAGIAIARQQNNPFSAQPRLLHRL